MYLLNKKFFVFSLLVLATISQAQAEGFEVYGFAQLDYMQDTKRMAPAWKDAFRPSKINTTDGQYGSDGQVMMSGKQSKLGVQSSLPVDGSILFTKFEFDFFGVGADEGKVTPRFRHAYGQWRDWLGGQTNSLFMDGDIFPNTIEYWGPCGMVFYRLPQIRWTPIQGDTSLAFAIEKPGDDIDPGLVREIDPNIGANLQADEKVPDLTAQWRKSGPGGHLQLAGILRKIGYETLTTTDHKPSDQKTGWGVDLTGSIKFQNKNKILLGVVTGQGIASYMNDGGTDLGADGTTSNVSSKLIPLTGVLAYYDHNWSDKWTSSFGVSQTEVTNSSLQAATAFNRGQYASMNLLHLPGKNMMTGAEILYGTRRSNDGTMTDDGRLQVSMKYNFSSNDFEK